MRFGFPPLPVGLAVYVGRPDAADEVTAVPDGVPVGFPIALGRCVGIERTVADIADVGAAGVAFALAVLLLAAAYAVVSGMVKRQLTQTEERP